MVIVNELFFLGTVNQSNPNPNSKPTGVARPSASGAMIDDDDDDGDGQRAARGPQTNGIILFGAPPGPSGCLDIVHPLATPLSKHIRRYHSSLEILT